MNKFHWCAAAGLSLVLPLAAMSAPVTYDFDPSHTYPSFAADHLGGVSVWRGKFNSSRGLVVLDREALKGSIDVTVDIKSIDFGNDELNAHVQTEDFFDEAKYPTANFKGQFTEFNGDVPTQAEGLLTLHGVSHPLVLNIKRFKCMEHPMEMREVCGADITATFNRADYGLDFLVDQGFKPEVELQIQVEALRRN